MSVYQFSPTGIDEHYPLFHLGNRLIVDDITRLIGKRTMKRNNIGIPVKIVERCVLDMIGGSKLFIGIKVVSQYTHSETAQQTYQYFGYSRTYNTYGFLVHIKPHKTMQ